MIELIEPMWGQNLLLWMHQVMEYHFWSHWLPVVADAFVFVYPVYLVVLYGVWMIQRYNDTASQRYRGWKFLDRLLLLLPGLLRQPLASSQWQALKESAVWIFVAAMASTVFNMLIQVFLVKDRPDIVMDLMYQKREDLILYDYLPEASFPSDHATMSMAIAVATLVWGLRYKKQWYVYFSVFLFVISGIMGYARISIGIHWPTDVIGGYVVGIMIPLVLFLPRVYRVLKKWVFDRLIGVEEWIVKRLKVKS
jgi:membrane-associated phospholipid phosphatase